MSIEHPKIMVSYKKFDARDCGFVFNDCYYVSLINSNGGMYFADDQVIILSYGDFFKDLMKKHDRTLEQQTCYTISHEILHDVLFKEQNIKVCKRLDNIASRLAEYGIW